MGEQLGIHLITIEEIHKNKRVTEEMREEKYRKRHVCYSKSLHLHNTGLLVFI